MGHRGGRGATRKPPENTKKKQKNPANTNAGTSSESSDSDHSKKSHEELSRAAELQELVRAQSQHEVQDEIFQENSTGPKEVSDKSNHESAVRSAFFSAPGDDQRSEATTITKQVKQTAPVKRRRQSLDDEQSIRDEIFDNKSFEEQTIIVVNNLSAEISKQRNSYLKETKAIKDEIKSLDTDVGTEIDKIIELENTVTNMAKKIETLNTTITEMRTESKNGNDNVHDLVTAVRTLSTKVEEQNITINGLITGKIDLKDTTGIQNKIDEVMKEHLKSLSETVVKQAERGVRVTQNRCNDIFTVANKLLNGHDRPQKHQDKTTRALKDNITTDEEVMMMETSSADYDPLKRNSSGANHDGTHNNNPSGANHDGTHNNQRLQIGGLRPGKDPAKSYLNAASTHLPPGAPQPSTTKYNQKQNNRGTFDRIEAEVPKTTRKDYPTFPDGNIKWVEHYVPAKPPLSEQQQTRQKKQWERDRDRTDAEVIVFMIPTRDGQGNIHSKDFDNAQVIRLFKECARGGYWLKPGDIKYTIRQIGNSRNPHYIPITVTCKDRDVAERVLEAASNIKINGSRRVKDDDKEKGRFGFLRPSLTPQERKAIRDKKREKQTPAGQGQAELKKRQYESRTGPNEWAELITEEYNGEEAPPVHMVVDDTTRPITPARNNVHQDENLNKISPAKEVTSQQTAQEKENEKLKKQLALMAEQAEKMPTLNDRYRERNATMEDTLRKDKDEAA